MNLLREVLRVLDPRLHSALLTELREGPPARRLDGRLVLVGHRAAGKSSLLPAFARASGRVPVDLDRLLEQTSGVPLRTWYQADPAGFRAAERVGYTSTARDAVVAVGGGFLSLHADLLEGDTAVLVPVSLDTYRERLRGDLDRPRLRPELPVDDELALTWHEREAQHREAKVASLAAALLALSTPNERHAWLPG